VHFVKAWKLEDRFLFNSIINNISVTAINSPLKERNEYSRGLIIADISCSMAYSYFHLSRPNDVP